MAGRHVYLMEVDKNGNKKTVYPVTDVNSIIGFSDKNGDIINQIEDLKKRVENLEKRVHYY